MTATLDLDTTVRNLGGDPADLPFWHGCEQGKFLLHRCDTCHRHYWPASRCVEHGAKAMSWVESSGRGELYTYTVLHKALTSSMKDKVPYVVAVVKLDEGPLYHTNIVGCGHDQVAVGMRLQAVMTEHQNGMTIPVFQPDHSGS
jgi:uncharacterized protein